MRRLLLHSFYLNCKCHSLSSSGERAKMVSRDLLASSIVSSSTLSEISQTLRGIGGSISIGWGPPREASMPLNCSTWVCNSSVVMTPVFDDPIRPILPAIWRYSLSSFGRNVLYTCVTAGRSRPREEKELAISRLVLLSLNAWRA